MQRSMGGSQSSFNTHPNRPNSLLLSTPSAELVEEHRHMQVPIRIGKLTVYASSIRGFKNWKPPDLGVYLDPSWGVVQGVFVSPGSFFRKNAPPPWEAIIVHWPDMGVIWCWLLASLVRKITADASHKRVEVGCVGGHGRTGTLLAAIIMNVERLGPKAAIKEVRRRYCERAVETALQEQLLAEYGDYITREGRHDKGVPPHTFLEKPRS